MQIEPRVVEPGFIKRWSFQSLSLIFRSPIIWSLIVLVTFFGGQLFDSTIWYLLFGGLVFMFSMEIAAYTDHSTINFQSFINTIFNTWNHYLGYLKENKFYFLIFTSVLLISESILLSFPSIVATKGSTDFELLNPLFSTVLFGYLFFNHGGELNLFSYPIKRAFDSKESLAITATCHKASIKNPKVTLLFELFLFFALFLICLIIPFFSIILVGFLPCFVYVAFREIFLGQNKNQEQEQSATSQEANLIPIKISSTN